VSTEQLYKVVAQVMGIPISKVNDDSSPEVIESWDSFHGLVLLDEIETVFNVKFTLDEVNSIKTISDIKKILRANHGVVV
jgi:acyl carrier protein